MRPQCEAFDSVDETDLSMPKLKQNISTGFMIFDMNFSNHILPIENQKVLVNGDWFIY